jgi:hypothetical protein
MKTSFSLSIILLLTLIWFSSFGQVTSCSDRSTWWDTSEEYRIIGGQKLKKTFNGYYTNIPDIGIRWLESYPGVVRVDQNLAPANTELHIYNHQKKLSKIIKIKELNPYPNMVNLPISEGYYNFDMHNVASVERRKEGLEPTHYLTSYYQSRTNRSNGITTATYNLYAFNENSLLSISSAIVFISPDGSLINTYMEESNIPGVFLSKTGSSFLYYRGNKLNNPLLDTMQTEYIIREIETNKTLKLVKAENNRWIEGVVSASHCDDLLQVAYNLPLNGKNDYELELIDLDHRKIYTRTFAENKFANYWERYGSFRAVLENELASFNVLSF